MRNIELKAHLRDREKAIRICDQLEGACFEGDIEQTDTYFRVPEGRFKLRVCVPGETYLVYYHRENTASAKASDYTIEYVRPEIRGILAQALGVLTEVRKVRTLYLWKNVRIHLDRVEGLGDFLEFEAVLFKGETEIEGYRRVEELSDLLDLKKEDLLEGSYLDLTLNR